MSRPGILTLVLTAATLALPVQAEQLTDKLSLYGYLTQAYADSDDHQILGISTDGTFDYRSAALQFRYEHDESNTFIIQLSHERVGESPFFADREDVEVDWAYYQYSFTDNTNIQAGRAPIPFGIYNKIRDNGTLLPFFRPADTVYTEGTFISETLDGVIVSHSFAPESPWNVDTELYLGEWDTINATLRPVHVDDVIGLQLWLNTPVPGLRFGFNVQQSDVTQFLPTGASLREFDTILASVDVNRTKYLFQAEYQTVEFDNGGEWEAWYVQAGYRPTPKIGIYVQKAESQLYNQFGPAPVFSTLDTNDDTAVSFSYAFRPEVVLRAEMHWNEGFTAEDLPPGAFFGPPIETNYSILSLSVRY